MTTTDEMREKLIRENEQLEAEIKEIDDRKKPKHQQLKMNRRVLELINRQKAGKRKYTKKSKQSKEADKQEID